MPPCNFPYLSVHHISEDIQFPDLSLAKPTTCPCSYMLPFWPNTFVYISTKLVQTFNHAAIEGHANYTQLCGTVQQGTYQQYTVTLLLFCCLVGSLSFIHSHCQPYIPSKSSAHLIFNTFCSVGIGEI